MIRSAALALLAASTLLVGARQQDPWFDQVDEYLSETALAAALTGAVQSHRTRYGVLNDGGLYSFTAQLTPGFTYIIAGQCDDYCSDLDLQLFRAADGRFIKEDTELDSSPVIFVTPEQTRSFRVRVFMAACEDEPCRWGAAIYRVE